MNRMQQDLGEVEGLLQRNSGRIWDYKPTEEESKAAGAARAR